MKTWAEIYEKNLLPDRLQAYEERMKHKDDEPIPHYKLAWSMATPEQLVILKQLREDYMKNLPPGYYYLVEGDIECTLLPDELKVIVLAREAKLAKFFDITGTVEQIREQLIVFCREDEESFRRVDDDWEMDLCIYLRDIKSGYQFKL